MNGTEGLQVGNYYLDGYPDDGQNELLEAENMVLGAVFLEPSIINELILEPYHLLQNRNQVIFKAMTALRQQSIND